MENTNKPEGSIRIVWEILPGDTEHIFEILTRDEIDPNLLSSGPLIKAENFPTCPYPLLNPASDCLDRVWNQSVIKVEYQSAEWFDQFES